MRVHYLHFPREALLQRRECLEADEAERFAPGQARTEAPVFARMGQAKGATPHVAYIGMCILMGGSHMLFSKLTLRTVNLGIPPVYRVREKSRSLPRGRADNNRGALDIIGDRKKGGG